MKINQDILNKADAKIAEKEYESKCLKAMICPLCGSKLTTKTYDELLDYICTNKLKCEYTHPYI